MDGCAAKHLPVALIGPSGINTGVEDMEFGGEDVWGHLGMLEENGAGYEHHHNTLCMRMKFSKNILKPSPCGLVCSQSLPSLSAVEAASLSHMNVLQTIVN